MSSTNEGDEELRRIAQLSHQITDLVLTKPSITHGELTVAILATLDAATKLNRLRDNTTAIEASADLIDTLRELATIEGAELTTEERCQLATDAAFRTLTSALTKEGEHAVAIIFCDNDESAFMRGTPGGPNAAEELREIADATERALAEAPVPQ